MSTLTLVGTRLAEPGTEFVYRGEASGCTGCPYRDQCLTLTEGHRYRITDVRENASTLDCAVHADGVRAVEVEGLWADATYPWDLLYLTRRLLEEGRVRGTEQHPGIHVSPSARVHRTATLLPPVVVGDDCEVGAGAVVGPNVALGRNVTVGANATVVDSVVDTDTRVGIASTLVETVTGENVDLGAGTVVSGGPGDVTLDDRVFRDQDLGAVFADRVRTGGRVAADPGTLVGPGAYLHTGVTVSGRVGADAEVTR